MTGTELKSARTDSGWTQAEAATRLGVTQAYLSMVERGIRAVSAELQARVLDVVEVPATALPVSEHLRGGHEDGFFQAALGGLGYPGFAYLGSAVRRNPAELLLMALDEDDLDARVTEGLSWVPLRFPGLAWEWLTTEVKLRDRQNRLGFVMELARQVAGALGDAGVEAELAARVARLERSRLVVEDTLCRDSMTRAERNWVRGNRTKAAEHWNLLTDLRMEHLVYANG